MPRRRDQDETPPEAEAPEGEEEYVADVEFRDEAVSYCAGASSEGLHTTALPAARAAASGVARR